MGVSSTNTAEAKAQSEPGRTEASNKAVSGETAKAGPESREDLLKKQIEEERKKRFEIIRDVKFARNRLAYKIADKAAISQLSDISRTGTKSIGFLRRRKEQLEFRISTEAFTLDEERELIRKKGEIEAELAQALKSFRLRKKLEFINGDIESLTKRIDESEKKIKESDKRLDELYSRLREMTGEARRRLKPEKKARDQAKPREVSLADIAVIKERKEDKQDQQEIDESVLN